MIAIVSAIGVILIVMYFTYCWWQDIGIAHVTNGSKIQTKVVKYSPLGIYIPNDNIDLINLKQIGLDDKYEKSGTILNPDDMNVTWALIKDPKGYMRE